MAVSVRNKVVTAITSVDDYKYSAVPVINSRGFEILADSDEKIKTMLDEYKNLEDINDSKFFVKWVKFNTYKKNCNSKAIITTIHKNRCKTNLSFASVTVLMTFGFVMMMIKGIIVPCIILAIVWLCHLIYFIFFVKTIAE